MLFPTPPNPYFCQGLAGHTSVLCKHCPKYPVLESYNIHSFLKIKISNFFLTHGEREGTIKLSSKTKQNNKKRKITSFVFSSYSPALWLPALIRSKALFQGRIGVWGKNIFLYFYLYLICGFTMGSCFIDLALLWPVWASVFSLVKWGSWIKNLSDCTPTLSSLFLISAVLLFISSCSLAFSQPHYSGWSFFWNGVLLPGLL